MTALVGPLPAIWFQDGSRIAYAPPRNTLDNRYAACNDHHPACDCREACWAEERQEYRAERAEVRRAGTEVLSGHVTYAWCEDGQIDYARRCQCTGCQIARSCHGVRGCLDQAREGISSKRPADWKAPR